MTSNDSSSCIFSQTLAQVFNYWCLLNNYNQNKNLEKTNRLVIVKFVFQYLIIHILIILPINFNSSLVIGVFKKVYSLKKIEGLISSFWVVF
jgi:hypothetical protein